MFRLDRPELEPNCLDTEPGSTPWGACRAASLDAENDVGEKKQAEPVSAGERFFAVDVLRGFALLGILAMNIVGFGWPLAAYGNPFRGGGFEGLDRGIWFFNHMVFEAKMMTIFSMLFGAGLVLMDQRAEARGAKIRGVYYRRILWLLVIGLVHSYLIWDGDILVLYAQTGLFLYFFRNLAPKTLIILGISAMLVLVPMVLGFGAAIDYMKAATARVEAQTKAGEKPSSLDQQLHDIWTKHIRDEVMPSDEKKAKDWDKEMAAYRGGYLGIVKHKAFDVLMEQIFGFLFGGGFFAASRMLVGMGLMKLGVFSAQRSRRFYWWMVGLGYGLGLPLMIFDAIELIRHRFSFDYFMHGGVFYNAVRQPGRGPGSRGAADADRAERRARLAHHQAGRGGPHGPLQLPFRLDRLHDAFLRLWLRALRPHQPHRAGRDRADVLDHPASCSARSGSSTSATAPPSGSGGP